MVGFGLAVVSLVLLSAALCLVPTQVPRAWRGDVRLERKTPGWWPYGPVAWRGYVRMIPVTTSVGGPGLVLAFWCFMLLTSINGHDFVTSSSFRDWLHVGVILGAASAVVGSALGMVVFLFNQPHVFVAPYLRAEPGAISEWLRDRR